MSRKTQKKLRKLLTLVSCAVLLVCVTIGATVAYLTSTKTVTNTFTVGKVDITLDEALVNADGKPIDENNQVVEKLADAKRVEANDYHLLPSHEYTKDPTVTVLGGSEECYVRVFVKLTNSENLDTVFPNAVLTDLFSGYDETAWEYIGNVKDESANTRTYELRYKETVSALQDKDDNGKLDDVVLPAVFTGFTIPSTIDNTNLGLLQGTKIIVTAEAIQADGFKDAAEAWAAFK